MSATSYVNVPQNLEKGKKKRKAVSTVIARAHTPAASTANLAPRMKMAVRLMTLLSLLVMFHLRLIESLHVMFRGLFVIFYLNFGN